MQSGLGRWAPIPLRLMVGYGFVVHGYLKLERGIDVFAAALAGLNLPAPSFLAWSTALTELVCGLAVLLGLYIRWVSVPMVIVLLVAIVTVHWQFGFSSIKFLAVTSAGPQFGKPGVETDLLYLTCIATLLVIGTGPFAIDNLRKSGTRASEPIGSIRS